MPKAFSVIATNFATYPGRLNIDVVRGTGWISGMQKQIQLIEVGFLSLLPRASVVPPYE
jgi:hypothetical protein